MATNYKVIVAVKPESTVTTQPSVLLFATSNAGVRQKAVALRKQHFAAYGGGPDCFFLHLQDDAGYDFTPATGKNLVGQRDTFQSKLQAGNAALLGEIAEKLEIDTVVLVNTMLADILVSELHKASVSFVWATEEDKQQSDSMLPHLVSLKPQPPRTETSQSTTTATTNVTAPLKTCKPAFPLPATWRGLSRAELCPLLAGPDGRFGARVVNGCPATGNQRIVISGSEAQMGCAYESDKMRWFEINAQFVNTTNTVVKEVYAYVAAVDAGHAQEIVTRWVKENDPNVAFAVQADQLNGLYLFDWHVACKDVTVTNDLTLKKYLVDRRAEVEANSFYHTQAYKNELNGNSSSSGVDDNRVTALEQKVAALTAANEALSQQVKAFTQPQQSADIAVLLQRVTALETVNIALQQKLAQQNAVIDALAKRIAALEEKSNASVNTFTTPESAQTQESITTMTDYCEEEAKPSNGTIVAELEAQKSVVADIQTKPDVSELVKTALDTFDDDLLEAVLGALDERHEIATELNVSEMDGNLFITGFVSLTDDEVEVAKADIAKAIVERSAAAMPEATLTPQQAAFEAAMASGTAIQPNPADEGKKAAVSEPQKTIDLLPSKEQMVEFDKNMSDPNKVLTLEHGFVNKTTEIKRDYMFGVAMKYCHIQGPNDVSPSLTGEQREKAIAQLTTEWQRKQNLATQKFVELFSDDIDEAERQLTVLLQQFSPHRFEDVDDGQLPDGTTVIGFKGALKGTLGYYTLNKGGDKLTATFLCQG